MTIKKPTKQKVIARNKNRKIALTMLVLLVKKDMETTIADFFDFSHKILDVCPWSGDSEIVDVCDIHDALQILYEKSVISQSGKNFIINESKLIEFIGIGVPKKGGKK